MEDKIISSSTEYPVPELRSRQLRLSDSDKFKIKVMAVGESLLFHDPKAAKCAVQFARAMGMQMTMVKQHDYSRRIWRVG